MNPSPTPSTVHELRVSLRTIKPRLWRRLQVRSESTLAELHAVLCIAFAWSGVHPYHFRIHDKDYGPSIAPSARLVDLDPDDGERFVYVYACAAPWECVVVVEGIWPADASRRYPLCLGGRQDAPPENCAGPAAYLEWQERIRTPMPQEVQDNLDILAAAMRQVRDADPKMLVQDAIQDFEQFSAAVARLGPYFELPYEPYDRKRINKQLRAHFPESGGRSHG